MLTFDVQGTGLEIAAYMSNLHPEIGDVLERITHSMTRYTKREIRGYEAATLYALAKQFDLDSAEIFEIGACYGWSASVMANAAPRAHIVTCTPNPVHVVYARENLKPYPRVEVREARSVDLLNAYHGPLLDMLFIDGDHEAVADDMPWWNWLKPGGLMFHHDYSPADSPLRPCRRVWDVLNGWAEHAHPFDVRIADENREGMAGWYRCEDETWPTRQEAS
jgi:predicted O-methyltransferase YrrM